MRYTESVMMLSVIWLVQVHGSGRHVREQHINDALNTVFPHTCPGCGDLKADVSESELAKLRVDFIKTQILKKLKLKEPPNVAPVNKLPLPLLAKNPNSNKINRNEDSEDVMDYDDDYFGTTNQVIIFPVKGYTDCELDPLVSNTPVTCFTFELPNDLEINEIASVDLWTYKQRDFLDGSPNVNQTYLYSTLKRRQSKIESSLFDRHITKLEDGWIKLDVLDTVVSWLEFNERKISIKVSCVTCGYRLPWLPVSLNSDLKPFLRITTDINKKKRRLKRNINCSAGVSECCREKLYISFIEMGWSDWVIQPLGYDAYFCRGSCSNAASLALSGSGYSSVVRKLYHQGTKKLELVPCCTATHLSSLQLLYMDNNQTITQKTLPNMVVDSCGCM